MDYSQEMSTMPNGSRCVLNMPNLKTKKIRARWYPHNLWNNNITLRRQTGNKHMGDGSIFKNHCK